ncbi:MULTISPECIES: alpha amylase C-terminal domain-containing protein [Bradyrhizobium]|uniref:alpha amylase C-terminal domain-containing protein n=1 Tax=Bradyrhizobium TaxID=374 RepID=UPI002163426A|nr:MULTISPECIES: alpha amylase C-terminal domain-containing protein [Bradyrhizobium]
MVASFNERTQHGYQLPFPVGGYWFEVFNTEAYDSMPAGGGLNTNVAGNSAGIVSDGPPLGDQPNSATMDIPANGVLVFARDRGDPILKPI